MIPTVVAILMSVIQILLIKYLCSHSGSVEEELCVGELVARVNGQGLCVQTVCLVQLVALEGCVAILFLLTQELGFL